MSALKPYVTYGMTVLLLIGFMVLFSSALKDVSAPYVEEEGFGTALWVDFAVTMIIISFAVFAGGLGVLVLLGGEWRWR
ncbi:MAG: hypothetical protein AB1665_06615 [Candidatus Thermoplasmatota archaeon]